MGVRQVKSSGGNVIGTFPSLKMREQIPYESTIERKPTAHLNEAHSQQQLALGQAWANANQQLFVVITDTDLRTGHRLANLKLLWRYSRLCVPPSITSRCRSILIAQADAPLSHGIQPPVMTLLHELARMIALVFELRLGQFLELSVGDDAGPIGVAADLVDLDADLGIGAHPSDLLSESRKHINVICLVGDSYRDDIGLIVQRAAKAGDGGAGEDFAAFRVVQFVDLHRPFPYPS